MEDLKREVFEQLGKLFYAMAKDQQVQPVEIGGLKMMMRKDWLADPQYSTINRFSEASHLIINTIDSLQDQMASSEQVFNDFDRFYETHFEQFSAALKQQILATAVSITQIFPSGRQLKNNRIKKLKLLFSKSPTY